MFLRSKRRLTPEQRLAVRPVRLVGCVLDETPGGGGRLKVPVHARGWAKWLLRMPEGAAKTFELDELGRFVWDRCDGTMTVLQIARRLARQYRVTDRQAQVATEKFLSTLANKGLVGGAVT